MVAVKYIEGDVESDTEGEFYKEIDILRNVRHANIVQFMGANLEKVRGGSVESKKNTSRPDVAVMLCYHLVIMYN